MSFLSFGGLSFTLIVVGDVESFFFVPPLDGCFLRGVLDLGFRVPLVMDLLLGREGGRGDAGGDDSVDSDSGDGEERISGGGERLDVSDNAVGEDILFLVSLIFVHYRVGEG